MKKERRKKKHQKSLEEITSHMPCMDWISPMATEILAHQETLAHFLSEVLAQVATASQTKVTSYASYRMKLAQNMVKFLIPQAQKHLENIENSFRTLSFFLNQESMNILSDSDTTRHLIEAMIEHIAQVLEKNPQWIVLFRYPDLLVHAFGPFGDQAKIVLELIPALSQKASEAFSDLQELLFTALYILNEKEREELYSLANLILKSAYKHEVIPKLENIFQGNSRGKILIPLLEGILDCLPEAACLNTALFLVATPQSMLTTGKVVSLSIQSLGGMYIKFSQILAEISPPSLAKELQTNQDNAGGLYPSVEKSWEAFLDLLKKEEVKHWLDYIVIPPKPQKHFASASMGALYEMTLNPAGQKKYHISSVLFKVQRPHLEEKFQKQVNDLISLCEKAKEEVQRDDVANKEELLGLVLAVERGILNYFEQSLSELDFSMEEKNAKRIQETLRPVYALSTCRYLFASSQVVVMERIPGQKITRMIQTNYLERKNIADTLIKVYLELLFEHGFIWTDPHPGNILFDTKRKQLAILDLNPCFVWNEAARKQFQFLLYRLFLRDAKGVQKALESLVKNSHLLQKEEFLKSLQAFLGAPISSSSLMRFVGEFLKTLNEHKIELKTEIQAALRGLSQLAITASSISARHDFVPLFRKYFGVKDLLSTAFEIGFKRVFRTMTAFLFEMMRLRPEEDVGPVLDERDIRTLSLRLKELHRGNVCSIRLVRLNPDDHPHLMMNSDGSRLLVTSDLRIHIQEEKRPAKVQYIIEIPTKEWLMERQEFVKLSGLAKNFCVIECLEQMRRNSLDDYWKVVEAWNSSFAQATVWNMRLKGEVLRAGRKLYKLRFENLWKNSEMNLSWECRWAWKFLVSRETKREIVYLQYLTNLKPHFENLTLANMTFGTAFRVRMLFHEALLWWVRKLVKNRKYEMHLLPLSTDKLSNVLLQGLDRKHYHFK